MIKSILHALFFCAALACNSQTADFLKNANSVVLRDYTHFELFSDSKYVVKHDYLIKILNRYAVDEKEILIQYDDFSQIKELKIEVFDAKMYSVEILKEKDMNDISLGSDVASDSRAKYAKLHHNTYPFTINVSYIEECNGAMHYPTWNPQPKDKMAVAHAEFKISNFTQNEVRFFGQNVKDPIRANENPSQLIWRVDSIPAYAYESFSSSYASMEPLLYTAPTAFEIAGVSGNMSSWDEFGKFILKLNSGKNDLSDGQKSEIISVVNESDSELEKVQKIYAFLQQNTRYVSIQLGLGGWAPFDASFVHEKKYGDCKALSYYTKSALEAVGIKSYYTLIRAKKWANPLIQDFPNAHFNHAILTVPLKHDTLWLECTSQTSPFGYMGTFTGNRSALLITENGADLIKTKQYGYEENEQITITQLELKNDGSGNSNIKRIYRGLEIENDNFVQVYSMPKMDQEKWFYDNLGIGSFEIQEFNLQPVSSMTVPETGFQIRIENKKAATSNSNRLFIRPAFVTNIDGYNLTEGDRKTDVEIKYGYSQIDSLELLIPSNYFPESLIENTHINSPFGTYSVTISPTDRGLLYVRKFTLKEGLHKKESYSELVGYIDSVQKMDRQKLVFLAKT